MLKIVTKMYDGNDLGQFKFWQGAKDRVEDLTANDLDIIFSYLEEYEEMTDTELNDFFWFEDDTYAEWLGYEDAEDLWNNRR